VTGRIYYFTATGNSIYIARQIADRLGRAELISIPAAIGQTGADTPIDASASVIGLVFPVYGWGMPRIVAEFVETLRLSRKQYVFAVATCGGTAATTLPQLQKQLRQKGTNLDAGFTVREGSVASANDPAIIRLVRGLNWKKPGTGQERLEEIVETVKARRKHRPESSALPSDLLGGLFHRGFPRMAKNSDQNLMIGEQCSLCGICVRVCPRGNITIEESRLVRHHNCEMCGACYQWCPKKAINLQKGEIHYYRHPEVKLKDILLR